MARLARLPAAFLAVPFILLFYFLALDSMVGDSPTMDEQNHLARGYAFLRTGDPRLSLEHPPLINSISALPLLTEPGIDLPTDHPSWQQRDGWYAFANELLWVRNDDATRLVFLARFPIVYLTLALGLIGFHFGRELWGRIAAFFAFILLLFEPNILAHGRYTTTDIGGATFVLLAAYLLWRLWKLDRWSWRHLIAAGIAVGLALGSKLSSIVFMPILFLNALLPLYGHRWRWKPAGRRVVQLFLATVIGIGLLWAIYGFEWGPSRFEGDRSQSLTDIQLPMPTYWAGLEQIIDLSGGGRPSYLFGDFSDSGWWYYFPVTFLVKTPIVILLLTVLASLLLLIDPHSRASALFLLLPSVIYFLLSTQSALNIGYRHLLPIIPFLLILISGLANVSISWRRIPAIGQRFGRLLLVIGVFVIITLDLLLHPHYLSYFNLFAGGPANGHKIIVDSNLDWGQDMVRLKQWMVENDVQRIRLSFFGTADPNYYDITYDPLPGLPYHFELWWDAPFNPEAPEPGVYAISASTLWELPLEDKNVFPWFRDRQPDDRIGYSIHIYYVNEDG